MQPCITLTGPAAPLLWANIDTDLIIRIERLTQGDPVRLGAYALDALRYRPDGTENPGSVLYQAKFRGASILLTGANFGCGSSREGAALALPALGRRCIIAESFGDIFFGNCFQNGMLPIRLPRAAVLRLAAAAQDRPSRSPSTCIAAWSSARAAPSTALLSTSCAGPRSWRASTISASP